MLKKNLKPSDVKILKFEDVNLREFKWSQAFQAKAIQFYFFLILDQSHPKNTP